MVTAIRLKAPASRLLDPGAAEWRSAPEEALALEPTPWGAQPSEYVQVAWRDRPYGLTHELRVASAHNGEAIFFRLRWQDETKNDGIADTDQFADATAVLFPLKGDAPLSNMGSRQQPVNAWYWGADLEEPVNVTAQGLGTTVRHQDGLLEARGLCDDGGWQVVISRPLAASSENAVALRPGQRGKVGFAVWQGSNQERAGIKAVTPDWQPLEIEE